MTASRPAAARPLVDHLVARDGPPSPRGLAYDYVLAGDGLWLAAENAALRVRAPVARCAVRGLPPLGGACELKHGHVPGWIWDGCAEIARLWSLARLEVLVLITCDAAGRYARVVYTRPDLPPGAVIALALHSHHTLPAYFSATDDGDEQGLAVYGVLGRLDTPRPEVALRAGAYGAWLPVPWEDIFAGDRGAFRDTQFDATDGPHEAWPEEGER